MPFTLKTDASGIGVGAMLTQNIDGIEKIISFYSQLHAGAQKNYSTTEQEILGVIKAVEHFRQYLISSKFKIRTDHQALIFLLKKEHEKKRLARWALLLQEYDFEIEHIKGEENFTDLLSRAFQVNSVKINM